MQKKQRWWHLFGCGVCMGTADVVPGVSGGTIALVMGIYEDLISSVKTLTPIALFSPTKKVAWGFLLPLIGGILTALALFSHLLIFLLGDETYRIFLYATFTGLILASTYVCAQQIPRWRWRHLIAVLAGGTLAFIATGASAPVAAAHLSYHIDPWLILCGAIGISAMLLPGISGSYLFMILGVYGTIVGALADFTGALKGFSFDADAFFVLMNVLVGICLGAFTISRLISWLFAHYHSTTIALLIGFMVGALRAVWPFWSYRYITIPTQLAKGAQLQAVEPILPDIASPLFWGALACGLGGFLLVFVLEKKPALDKNPG